MLCAYILPNIRWKGKLSQLRVKSGGKWWKIQLSDYFIKISRKGEIKIWRERKNKSTSQIDPNPKIKK